MGKKKTLRAEAANADTFDDDADPRNRRLKQVVFMAGFEGNPSALIMRVIAVNCWHSIWNSGRAFARVAAEKRELA